MTDVKEEPIWTHTEHMAWGYKMLFNGFLIGFSLAAIIFSIPRLT